MFRPIEYIRIRNSQQLKEQNLDSIAIYIKDTMYLVVDNGAQNTEDAMYLVVRTRTRREVEEKNQPPLLTSSRSTLELKASNRPKCSL